jgi:hypothetical protein
MMTLALILGVCTLFVSSPGATPLMRATLIPAFQAEQTQSNSPQSDSQNSAQPTGEKAQPAQAEPPASPPSAEKKRLASPAQPPKTKTATAAESIPKKRRPRKKPVTQPATDSPTKVIVNNGGAPDPTVQLSPGVSPEAASRQRQSTTLLLSTTENNLKTVAGHQLNPSQQDTVTQIREYMKQAETSADAGDLQRAHTLAFKAKLLSDELAKH